MNKKKNIEIAIIAVGTIAMLFAVMGNLTTAMKKKMIGLSSAQQASKMAPLFTLKKQEEKKAKAELGWGRDPFILQEGPAGAPTFQLMGITPGKKMKAIIDNDIVAVGSKVGDYKVTKILKSKVILNNGKEDLVLKM